MERLIIFGTTNFSNMMRYYFERFTDKKVAAFTVNRHYIDSGSFNGLPVVPFEDIQSLYPARDYGVYLGIGYKKMNTVRENVYNACVGMGYEIESFIHPSAIIDEEVIMNCDMGGGDYPS